MFSIEWRERVPHTSGRTGDMFKDDKVFGKTRICSVTTWGMASCAIATLQEWGYSSRVHANEVDQFFEWLCINVDNDWQPMEFYFMFSNKQKEKYFKHFVKHPNVKLRDKFENKSHGPNHVYLYRYSRKNDFKRIVNRKASV
jgi:hypothetical protein